MRIVILPDSQAMSVRAAEIICKLVARKPNAVLGLATGGTPLGTYQELVRRTEQEAVCFRRVTSFNLDEYVGLESTHPQSYRQFMEENLFIPAGFSLSQCHLPELPSAGLHQLSQTEIDDACEAYENKIRLAGGIALQLLGIGSDGHIAFNEPGSSLASRTRVKALTEQTRQDNSRFFASLDEVPKLAITMGIGTILESKEILLLASGAGKAAAVRSFVEGPISALVPASALQLHPRVTVLLDEPAAQHLDRRAYYEYVETLQQELESSP